MRVASLGWAVKRNPDKVKVKGRDCVPNFGGLVLSCIEADFCTCTHLAGSFEIYKISKIPAGFFEIYVIFFTFFLS